MANALEHREEQDRLSLEKEEELRNRRMRDNYVADGVLGAFVAMGLVLMVWGLCWYSQHGTFVVTQKLNVIFREVAGLNENAYVMANGVRIGSVSNIELLDHDRVLTELCINSSQVKIREGSTFHIISNGIVGPKFVEIHLPVIAKDSSPPPVLSSKIDLFGEDPVRPELAVNKLAIGLSEIDMHQLRRNLTDDRILLRQTANELNLLSRSGRPALEQAVPLEQEMMKLSKEVRTVSGKLNRLIDDPKTGRDLRETVQQAKETVALARSLMTQVDTFLSDPLLREDMKESISKLDSAASNIQDSVKRMHEVVGDRELRGDVKAILSEARASLNKVDQIFSKPEVSGTLSHAKQAIERVDTAALQLNQIMDKRFPLFHLMLGRPGRIKKSDVAAEKAKSRAANALTPKSKKQQQDQPSATVEGLVQ